ncbi:MAG: hypothetical protein ABR578_00065, partial [Chromatocurvus sp.]
STIRRPRGDHALFIASEFSPRQRPYAFAVLPLSPGGFVPVDSSCFEGVRFEARGSGLYQVGIATPDSRSELQFSATNDWRIKEIPFAEFIGDNAAPDRAWPLVTEVLFGRRGAYAEKFWLELANLSFYGCPETDGAENDAPARRSAIEGVSFLGAPLYRHETNEAAKVAADEAIQRLVERMDFAEADYVALGRTLAAAGRYGDAIWAFGLGIQRFPDSYRLRRHRAHRFLTTRQIQAAGRDLDAARTALANEAPGQAHQESETDAAYQHWIWYHTGIFHYLNRDFPAAAAAFERCLETATTNDMLIGTVDWLYTSLMRAGNPGRAREALDLVDPDIDADRSYPYFKRVMFYKDIVTAGSIIDLSGPGDWTARDATVAYAIANMSSIAGDTEAASGILQSILATPYWNIWAYVQAEKDLAAASIHP